MIKRLLLLNGLAILGVVMYHATGWGFVAMFWWTDRYLPVTVPNFEQMGSMSYYLLRMIEQLFAFSIPAFLLVSGFFIARVTGRHQSTVSWRLVGTRVKYLVIPYLIWSMVMLILEVFLGRTFTIGEIIKILLTGQVTPAFYFVPLLVQLYILSPFIVPIAKTRWKLLLLITVIIEFAIRGLRYPYVLGLDIPVINQMVALTKTWFFPTRIFWFALGIVVGFNLQVFKTKLIRIKWGLLIAVVLLFVIGMIEWELLLRLSGQDWIAPWETIIDGLYALAFLLAFLAFDNINIPFSEKVGELGSKSYGIYLIHSLVLLYTSKVVYQIAPKILEFQIIFQSLLILMGLGVPLALMAFVNKTTYRKYYKYIFG